MSHFENFTEIFEKSRKVNSKLPFNLVPTSSNGRLKVVEREFRGSIWDNNSQRQGNTHDEEKPSVQSSEYSTTQGNKPEAKTVKNQGANKGGNAITGNTKRGNAKGGGDANIATGANISLNSPTHSLEVAFNKPIALDALKEEKVSWTPFQHTLNQIYFGNSGEVLMQETIQETLKTPSDTDALAEKMFQRTDRNALPPRTISLIQDFFLPTLEPSYNIYKIVCQKNAFNGKMENIFEIDTRSQGTVEKEYAHNSMSLLRMPSSRVDFVRGSTEQLPFFPGGMEHDAETTQSHEYGSTLPGSSEVDQLLSHQDLLTVPPGFSQSGLTSDLHEISTEYSIGKNSKDFISKLKPNEETVQAYKYEKQEVLLQADQPVKNRNVIRLDSIFGDREDDFEFDVESESEEEEEISQEKAIDKIEESKTDAVDEKLSNIDSTLDDLLSDFDPLSLLKRRKKKNKEKKWAIVDNTDVSNFKQLVPKMAIEYPFDLDTFQKRAVFHLENGESVFVAAHTSAGKTVVAEYAIALSQKHLTRVIYTSPIKTLSNQKFREFKKTFGDVGILTGDVQINPTATCLIMTTEILRSMLYRGADLIRDVEWVVFDEVHYLNDPDRGVVWEEVIIMLPKHINLILLSATIPNTKEFAEWVGRTKQKTVYVIQTLHRPVPLEHHIHYRGNLYKVVDANKEFLHQNYRNCIQDKKDSDAMALKSQKKMKTGHSKMVSERSEIQKLIETLRKRNLLPVVIFSFSRKKCESIGYGMTATDLTTSVEKSQIHVFVNESVSRLTGSDRQLPQVLRISELVTRGIGVHHSGMLPIVKEMVEMLFSRGLVKVLFATETFAMGVNFPTKCVVFNGLRKHDGSNFRELLSSEYTQMSGRAGRRGLDTAGIVIIHCNEDITEEHSLQKMILGKSTKLESQFKLSYNMMLNLMRVEDFKVEDMLKRSFSETHNQKYLPEKKDLELNQAQINDIEDLDCLFGEPDIDNYFTHAQNFIHASSVIMDALLHMQGNLLSGGRIVTVKTVPYGNVLGVVLKTTIPQSDSRLSIFFQDSSETLYIILVLKQKTKSDAAYPNEVMLPPFSSNNLVTKNESLTDVVVVTKNKILAITKEKFNTSHIQYDFSNQVKYVETKELRNLGEQLLQLWQKSPESISCYNELDIKQNTIEVAEASRQRQLAIECMKQSKCNACPKLEEQYRRKQKKFDVSQKLDTLKYALSDENLELMPEFNVRLYILRQLNYLDEKNTILLKGKVACEINSCDELIVTEMIFESQFTNLTPAECVSILSCLICKQKDEDEPNLTDRLQAAKDKLIELVDSLASIQHASGLNVASLEAQECLRFSMMEVAYEWANGVPFKEICKLTTIQEGNVVRYITQIAHACREVRNAARVIGDAQLYQKMEDASTLIKRDVIFAASLWIT